MIKMGLENYNRETYREGCTKEEMGNMYNEFDVKGIDNGCDNLYNKFYKLTVKFGNRETMRKRKAEKWLKMYGELSESNRYKFWVLLDKCNYRSVATVFEKIRMD